jgi:fumarylacetoacetase
MTAPLNDTHDPSLRSWVESAGARGTDFPIQNLPFGVFKGPRSGDQERIGVAIGDQILDLTACIRRQLLAGLPDDLAEACQKRTLNRLMALGPPAWSALRWRISELLRDGESGQAWLRPAAEACLVPMPSVELLLGVAIGDYTDFYASIHHAANVGRMMRPDNPLLPNYKYVPIAYHGRSSSIVVSGTPVRRPSGQTRTEGADAPVVGPTARLDYELEAGFFVGPGNRLGEPVDMARAEDHLFGVCLVNDWSARDIQAWEYQPLGPFLSKSFLTSVSPWIVTMEALAPYRVPPAPRPAGDPPPAPYLDSAENRRAGAIDAALEVALVSARMRQQGLAPIRLSRSNLQHLYWTPAQLLTHHASNGCNLRPGDLLASGTVSGPEKDQRACLLELTWRGTERLELPTGETRAFLEDGDEVILTARCERNGYATIGFGECRATVAGAPSSD